MPTFNEVYIKITLFRQPCLLKSTFLFTAFIKLQKIRLVLRSATVKYGIQTKIEEIRKKNFTALYITLGVCNRLGLDCLQ